AGIPAVLYVAQDDSMDSLSFRECALLVFIGWNSSLVLTGVFVLALLAVLRRVLFGSAGRPILRSYLAYGSGLALGNAGILFSLTSRIPTNRDAYIRTGEPLFHTISMFFGNQIDLMGWHYIHAASPLVFIYLVSFWVFITTKDRTLGRLIAGVILI